MFEKNYLDRMVSWRKLRDTVEVSVTPIEDVLAVYNSAHTSSLYTDPYNQTAWPNPWELVEQNVYCEFCKLLGVGYTLLLTERFSEAKYGIHIYTDYDNSQVKYFLSINDCYVHVDEGTLLTSEKPLFTRAIENKVALTVAR